ncbi:MAG: TauD/TfdA family dioxygenase, partial [Brasilonema sp.]
MASILDYQKRGMKNLSILRSQSSLNSAKIDLNDCYQKVSKIAEICPAIAVRIYQKFNKYNFIILECNPSKNPSENLLELSRLFGNINKNHDRANAKGITIIQPVPGFDKYIGATNREHFLHTDGPFERNPPEIFALQCEVAASSGGYSKIVRARDIYEYLVNGYPAHLMTLFKPDVLAIKRGDRFAKRAIFKVLDERVFIFFRMEDGAAEIEVKPEAVAAFNLIKEFVNAPNNQIVFPLKPHQILIADNRAILHGRSAFSENEPRLLNRVWFDGKSMDGLNLKLGFVPK